jgi:membrane-bound lytic murein transglycosylase A
MTIGTALLQRLKLPWFRTRSRTQLAVMVAIVTLMSVVVTSCGYIFEREPGIGKAVPWSKLPQWQGDDLAAAWPAMQAQCPRMVRKSAAWEPVCEAVAQLQNPSSDEVRAFLQQHFKPHRVHGKNGKRDGLITGYYEPILNGSRTRTDRFKYPIYAQPEDMLIIDLADLYPSLKGMRLRGRLDGNRVKPYWSREEIDGAELPLAGKEILWIDDPYGSFFTQIQGSGRVRLPDGSMVGVGYANQNGHPYVAVGKKLVEIGALPIEEVSLFTIKQWLQENPQRAPEILNANPSYVFFEMRESVEEGPRGSLNVPLTAERSIAVDRRVVPLGTPVWLKTTLPDGSPFERLVFAQDTGGAITGPVRADVFFGIGNRAEQLAGEMKQRGEMYALLPVEAGSL